ncbi:hypothetical protein SCP_0508750 [Sparassis crispa]|uniref:Heterokaryon incompatibility domain-containing protein n=1 Tax=Sparassis crispa TaxID=139825 RepID=A0A401GNM4_9APHY|nr:hypothetical protein SCP_0508750 [Sparassis crispa]GBE83818.1 hypothetical protein SCP_0508750 [Sparassis crispa]
MTIEVIYDVPLSSLRDKTVDLSSKGTPKRYRLIDCVQFTEKERLRIYEMEGFPGFSYCAISYVWRGNPISAAHAAQEKFGAFSVRGAEDGDKVGVDTLMHACTAAVKLDTKYVWLDSLCIMQTSSADQSFQIKSMHHIYQSCAACLVLPGGMRHLVSLEADTAWIQRGWTLQEVVAPKQSLVLFSWKHGSGQFKRSKTHVHELVSRRSAYAKLTQVLQLHTSDTVFTGRDGGDQHLDLTIRMFGNTTEAIKSHVWALLGAMLLSNLDAQKHAIWRSALMRTSSRPVDMVFSIMGLFGVTLDPKKFAKDDRVGATIALAQAILKKGGTASWLASSFHLPPSRQLSSFPIFPTTTVSGKAYIPTRSLEGLGRVDTDQPSVHVEKVIDGRWPPGWWLDHAPKGSMDDAGYLKFTAKAAPAVFLRRKRTGFPETANMDPVNDQGSTVIAALDGSFWKLPKAGENVRSGSSSCAFIVFIGNAKLYNFPWIARRVWAEGMTYGIVTMLVEEHASGKFSRVTFAFLGDRFKSMVEGWHSMTLSVGGPQARG